LIDKESEKMTNVTKNFKFGISVMGAIEKDFDCAGMCLSSVYFTFSEVEDGRPEITCAEALKKFAEKAGSTA